MIGTGPMRAEAFHRWWPAIVWALLILSSSGDAGSSASTTERWVEALFGRYGEDAVFIINYWVRKSGHVVAYGVLGALTYRGSGRPLVAVALAVVVAMADEGRQATSASRTGTWTDVGIDACGAVLGVMAAKTLAQWRARRPE